MDVSLHVLHKDGESADDQLLVHASCWMCGGSHHMHVKPVQWIVVNMRTARHAGWDCWASVCKFVHACML